jgi:hypothetical protein
MRRRYDQVSKIAVFRNKTESPLPQSLSVPQSPRLTNNNNTNHRSSISSKSRRFFLFLLLLLCASVAFGISRLVKAWNRRKKRDPLKFKPPTFHNATYFESTYRRPNANGNANGYDHHHIHDNHIDNDLRFVCSLRNKAKSTTPHADDSHALARFIVFQSNGAHQLRNFMTYYTQVINAQHMVIINHQTSPANADAGTDLLLDEYNSRGSDVWDCIGSFANKDEMWSWVTHRYTDVSDFVFPIDIDEYIAVLTPSTSSLSASTDAASQRLSWSKEHLATALHKLRDTGKPFKMERGNVYPVDCGIPHWEGELSISDTIDQFNNPIQNQNPNHYERSIFGKLQYVARKKHDRAHCMDKVFFRGEDFLFTDTGNHHGQTHVQPFSVSKQKCMALIDSDGSSYVQDADQDSDLFMVHMQFTTMEEWMMHALRGASDRGFNRFSRLKKCSKTMMSWEYCEQWKMLMDTKFDPREMQRMYVEKVCTSVVDGRIPVPIAQILNASE